MDPVSGVRRKFPREGQSSRHNRATSQINFKGSAEGTTILGAPGKILQNYTYKYAFLCILEASFSIMLLRDLLAGETEK